MKYIGLLTSAASGKLGGLVASHGRAGQYMRRHAIPVQPRTPAQRLVRNALAAASADFKSQGTTLIAGWNSLASTITLKSKIGTTYNPSGQQLYVSCCKHLASLGITPNFTAIPSVPSIPGITAFTASLVGNGTTVTGFGLATVPTPSTFAGYGVVVRATGIQSPGRTFVGKSAYRNIYSAYPAALVDTATAGTNQIFGNVASGTTPATGYVGKFGPLPAAGQIGFELRLIDAIGGFAGPPVSLLVGFIQSSSGVSFAVSVSAQSGTGLQTATTGTAIFTTTISAVTPAGFTQALTYSYSGLPVGTTAAWTHATLTASTTSNTLTITCGGTGVAAGTYTANAIITFGSYTATVPLYITVA